MNQNFNTTLTDALKKITNEKWLEENSVLASPYYLGEILINKNGTNNSSRGQVLQELIDECIEQLQGEKIEVKGKTHYLHQYVLRTQYFDRQRPVSTIWQDLNFSETTYHVKRNQAIEELGLLLVKRIHPSLRLELIPAYEKIVDRKDELADLSEFFNNRKHVSIVGENGTGKTALVAHFAKSIDTPVLWFTVRPDLNDSVASFVFDLGLFAHQHGESSLWQMLITGKSLPNRQTLIEQINFSVGDLSPRPLVCIDNTDKLNRNKNEEHRKLIQLWESLQQHTVLFFIGQEVLPATDEFLLVTGLSPEGTQAFFADHQIPISKKDVKKYYEWTGGNASQLRLCTSIFSLTQKVPRKSQFNKATLKRLIARVLGALPLEERSLIAKLSVYQHPIPLGYLDAKTGLSTFKSLQSKQIINVQGGHVLLNDSYRPDVYDYLIQKGDIDISHRDVKQYLHMQAAQARSRYGEHALAIFHLIRAGDIEYAIELWEQYGQQELWQGQAPRILYSFQAALEERQLESADKNALNLICAELENFLGQTTKALERLDESTFEEPVFLIDGLILKGIIHNENNDPEAKNSFKGALDKARALVEINIAETHKGLSWFYQDQGDAEQAKRELLYAQIEIDNMHGNIAKDEGSYEPAIEYYTEALGLARQLASQGAIAKISLNLGTTYSLLGQIEDGLAHLSEAYKCYEEMHKKGSALGCCITTAGVYSLKGDYTQAQFWLDKASQFLKEDPILTPRHELYFNQTKAEVLLGQGDDREAEKHVKKVLNADDKRVKPDAHRTYGEILMNQEAWKSALKQLKISISLTKENKDPFLEAYGRRALGRFYLMRNRPDLARKQIEQAIALFEEINLPNEADTCRRLLSVD